MPRYDYVLFDADNTLFDFDRAEAGGPPHHPGGVRPARHAGDGGDLPGRQPGALGPVRPGGGVPGVAGGGAVCPAAPRPGPLRRPRRRQPRLPDPPGEGGLPAARGGGAVPGAGPLLHPGHRHQRGGHGPAARFEASPLRDVVPWLFISEEVGASKPAPAFFAPVLCALGEPDRSRVLMVGTTCSPTSRAGKTPGWTRPGSTPAACPAIRPSSPPGRRTASPPSGR